MVTETGLDYLGFASCGAATVEAGGRQMPTGHLHINGFASSHSSIQKKEKQPPFGDCFLFLVAEAGLRSTTSGL